MSDKPMFSTDTCEVVPGPGELPCTRPREHERRPRLCSTHQQEYVRLTAEYHATTEEAKRLYRLVRAQGLNDAALVQRFPAARIAEAIETMRLCIDIIHKEIRERREHHTRFFVELDHGHEKWMKKQRSKLDEIKRIASRLRRREAALANPRRRWPRGPYIIASAHIRSNGLGSRTRYTPSAATRPVCIAHLSNDSRHDRVRCTREGILSTRRCQEHEDEHTEALSALRAAEKEYTVMGAIIYDIVDPSRSVSAQTLSQDILQLTRYIALADTIMALSETLSRLGGYFKPASSYRKADMAMDRLSRDVVADIRIKLERTRSELLRPKPAKDESYGWGTRTTATTVGTVVAVAVVGIAALLCFRRE